MKNRLKEFRVEAGKTQAKLAAEVGVTQPNYHRWETGQVPIPEDKLKKLSKALKKMPAAILGRHPPIEASLYDDSADDDLSYYGEVAIHFAGGGDPLLLSISEAAYANLHRDLQSEDSFVTVQSLANQTVAIRTKAISDLYFSSEAYDDYGPEHGAYDHHISLQMPDPRDWEIVECIASDDVGIEDFDAADVERVRKMIMITDEQIEELVKGGHIEPHELDGERKKSKAVTDEILSAATNITYQLSTGRRRHVNAYEAENVFNAFYELVDYGEDVDMDRPIRLEMEGRHRIIFINKGALDYVSIPTHKFKEGRIESNAADLDATSTRSAKKCG